MDFDGLSKKQEEMRLRIQRQKERKLHPSLPPEEKLLVVPEGRTVCINCRQRLARIGQVLCSRCTGEGLQQNLRSTLPGLPIITEVKEKVDHGSTFTSDISTSIRKIRSEPIPPPPSPPLLPSLSNGDVTYSRAQVCRMLGISGTTLSRWERKGKTPQPKRIVHNNQTVYTDSIITAIREYMSQEYTPPPGSSNIPGTRTSTVSAKKTAKISRQAERAVANRLGLGRRIL